MRVIRYDWKIKEAKNYNKSYNLLNFFCQFWVKSPIFCHTGFFPHNCPIWPFFRLQPPRAFLQKLRYIHKIENMNTTRKMIRLLLLLLPIRCILFLTLGVDISVVPLFHSVFYSLPVYKINLVDYCIFTIKSTPKKSKQ